MMDKEIPLLVKPRAVATPIGTIPLLIHQTYLSNKVPSRMYGSAYSWINKNPEFEYRFYDDERCLALIEEHFDARVLSAYHKLPKGAFRADFWRYCCLYIHGGVYADIDTVCRSSLIKLVDERDSFIVPRGVLHETFLYNAFICAAPKHPVTKSMIDTAVELIHSGMRTGDDDVVDIFAFVFASGDLSKVNAETAEVFGIVGPLGLGRVVNQLLNRPQHEPFAVAKLKHRGLEVRILRFTKRFGVSAGLRRVLDTRYEGYFDDQVNSGGAHWLSR